MKSTRWEFDTLSVAKHSEKSTQALTECGRTPSTTQHSTYTTVVPVSKFTMLAGTVHGTGLACDVIVMLYSAWYWISM